MTKKHDQRREEQCEWAALHALDGLSPAEEVAYQAHLAEGCPVCGSELRSFEEVAGQLGLAGDLVNPPPLLRRRLLARISRRAAAAQPGEETAAAQGEPGRQSRNRVLVFGDREKGATPEASTGRRAGDSRGVTSARTRWAVAAAVLLALGLGSWAGLHLRTGSPQLDFAAQEAYIDSLYAQVNAIIRVGLGDHVHCTVFRDRGEAPPSFEQMAEEMGPAYVGLVPLIQERVPREFRIVQAHQCDYRERKFVHVALESDQKLVSLVITRKSPAESFSDENLIPVLDHSGVPIYGAGVDAFEIAGFESQDHLVFVASDLTQVRNLQFAANLAPAVRDFLRQMEG